MTTNNSHKADLESIFYWLARHSELAKQQEYTEKQLALLTEEINSKVDVLIKNGNYDNIYVARKEFLYALTENLTQHYYIK